MNPTCVQNTRYVAPFCSVLPLITKLQLLPLQHWCHFWEAVAVYVPPSVIHHCDCPWEQSGIFLFRVQRKRKKKVLKMISMLENYNWGTFVVLLVRRCSVNVLPRPDVYSSFTLCCVRRRVSQLFAKAGWICQLYRSQAKYKYSLCFCASQRSC